MLRKAVFALSIPAFPIASLAVAALILGTSPVLAQQSSDEKPTVEEHLSEAEKQLGLAAQVMLNALRGIIASIPQYQMPEVLENGDIVIRRVQPDATPPSEGEKKDGGDGMKL